MLYSSSTALEETLYLLGAKGRHTDRLDVGTGRWTKSIYREKAMHCGCAAKTSDEEFVTITLKSTRKRNRKRARGNGFYKYNVKTGKVVQYEVPGTMVSNNDKFLLRRVPVVPSLCFIYCQFFRPV